ncbi:hypothetical protein OD917_18615 [Flavobacterium sp. SH_e]|uniref:hypothetical protein n=1 Tax=Flavobacterium TaxID=237 RepID=UPI0021E467A0|nr:hypothetical protein [Flavobacterium sp. SH_e]MCV2486951.1 hypothetical protein [Flavobacterium sp. SH_e]
MKTIFDKPFIFEGDDNKVVLMYSKYIISDITKDIAEQAVERIDQELFKIEDFESVINAEDVFEYEFERDFDSMIMFSIRKNGKEDYKNIEFKDPETTKEAEEVFKEHFKELGFLRKIEQLSAGQAAIIPLFATAVVAALGAFLTIFAYYMEDYVPERTKVVKWYVFILYKISQTVGYIPFLVLSVVLVATCLFWTFKRLKNPPVKISAVK